MSEEIGAKTQSKTETRAEDERSSTETESERSGELFELLRFSGRRC